ncbi:MAG TPA: hypothetical protein DEO65_15280 [Bacillus bacterium]|nr:hypothetical protein [Siminovitchia fordii]HBZ11203.1 hypothetical protein [Bacillus sp. (in: firmicutes)]
MPEPNGQSWHRVEKGCSTCNEKDLEDFKQTMINLILSNSQLNHNDETLNLNNEGEIKNIAHKEAPPKDYNNLHNELK